MKCTLEGSNARVIAKAIQSLSKVGKELFVEADQEGLLMRGINSTHSAVGSIRFRRSMFETFKLPDNAYCYCKIAMKACLGVFRNMKQVEHCELCILESESKFLVKLRCKLETIKQAVITIVDEQNITAAFSSDNCKNLIRGDFKIFMEISNNFNATVEELTFEAKSDSLAAKNYIEGARVNDKFMRSQLKLQPSEFEHYKVDHDTVITFCIREFRAFLLFAESLNSPMVLEFDDAGSPLFLKINKHNEIECLLIMSTLSPEDVSFSEEYCERDITEEEGAPQKRKSSNAGPTVEQKRRIAEDTTLSTSGTDTALFQFIPERTECRSEAASVQPARMLAEGDTVVITHDDDDEDNMLLAVADAVEASQQAAPSSTEVCFYNTEDAPSTQVPHTIEQSNDDEQEESIPMSPERVASVRRIFSRCFQSTYVPREPSPNSQVYAPNSDTED